MHDLSIVPGDSIVSSLNHTLYCFQSKNESVPASVFKISKFLPGALPITRHVTSLMIQGAGLITVTLVILLLLREVSKMLRSHSGGQIPDGTEASWDPKKSPGESSSV